MNIHEFQAKQLLQDYGVPIPRFTTISQHHRGDIKRAIADLGSSEAVIKIQVHAGGRGKAGGVKFAKNHKEIEEIAISLLGMKMINNQTGPDGVVANTVMLSVPVDIAKEYYISVVIDRENAVPIILASPEGGMEIEEIAHKFPEKILKIPITMDGRVRSYHLVHLAKFMGWKDETAKEGMKLASRLAKAFMKLDASLIEVNPLVLDKGGKLWALDAKISVDDNALYRQPEVAAMYDPSQYSASEVAAKGYDLAYIALDGNIGCMVNGAGLAMATMDIIKHFGGKPANFLDVGGGASKEKVAEGFRIILSDPKVQAIFVNIFGGIMNCATLAEGIIAAVRDMALQVPLVVRMEGTNVEEGKRLLRASELAVITADSLSDGAKKAVATLKK